MTVCVIGAGIAGVACARALTAAGMATVVLDRARAPGGRMASPRFENRPVDSGAQYFTVADPGSPFGLLVADWRARGLARAWTDTLGVYDVGPRSDEQGQPDPGPAAGAPTRTSSGPERWAARGGLRSLVADLAGGLEVRTETPVAAVTPAPAGAAGALVDGTAYDAVVLAMPDPQAMRLLDPSVTGGPGEARAQLADRPWTAQLSLLAGWSARAWDPGLTAAFVNGDPVLSLVADDGSRRGDGAAVLVAHSTADFAAARLDDPDAALVPMLTALRRVLALNGPDGAGGSTSPAGPGGPSVPATATTGARHGALEPTWARVHRWTFAAPAKGRDEPYLLTDSRIGACGDGWAPRSKVEAAWTSGDALGRELAARL